MTCTLPTLKNMLYILFFGIITFSCSDPKDSFPDALLPVTPVGEYKVTSVYKSWKIIAPGIDSKDFETLTTKCDLFSTIKLNANNTMELMDYNYNNDDDCSDFEKITGSWVKTGSSAGGFYGDLSLDKTFRGHDTSDGRYSSQGLGGKEMVIYFTLVEEGQKYSYSIWFKKI